MIFMQSEQSILYTLVILFNTGYKSTSKYKTKILIGMKIMMKPR